MLDYPRAGGGSLMRYEGEETKRRKRRHSAQEEGGWCVRAVQEQPASLLYSTKTMGE